MFTSRVKTRPRPVTIRALARQRAVVPCTNGRLTHCGLATNASPAEAAL